MAEFFDWGDPNIIEGSATEPFASASSRYNAKLYTHGNSHIAAESFQSTNGLLNETYNWDPYTQLPPEDERMSQRAVQSNTAANGKMSGLTGGADYYCDDAEVKPRYGAFKKPAYAGTSLGTARINWRIIPGTGLEFFLAETATVVFTWQIGGGNTERMVHNRFTKMAFMLDDWLDEVDGTKSIEPTGIRHIANGTFEHGYGNQPDKTRVRMPHRDRVWSGHFITTLAKGWHSAGIAAWQEERALKFRVRNMKAVWFYK